MAGIYIHIPFCKKACHYCNFHFSTTYSLLPKMILAIEKEVEFKKNYIAETVTTIYFGGGTPSICTVPQLASLLNKIKENFEVMADAEITLEANPDNINSTILEQWQAIGINRLSVGIQSFAEQDLLWMNRAHNSKQAIGSIQDIKASGISNFSIDLIYGTPTLTNQQWQQNVQQAIDFKIPHISCYALTVEPQTALHKMIATKKIANIENDKQAEQFELLMLWMQQTNYDHYEIASFALPTKRSQHNSSYWQGKNYIGLGPSAHSFNGTSRQWNIANNALYISSINLNENCFEQEILTTTQKANEYIMTSLRTTEGLKLETIRNILDQKKAAELYKAALKYSDKNLAVIDDTSIVLTNTGKLMADGIAADLFFV